MAKRFNESELTFQQRLSALKNLPALFSLVWQSSPQKTILSFSLRIVRSAMPVALLYIGKLIIDQVVHLNRNGGDQEELWQLVGIEFGLAILTDALNRAITLVDGLLGDLFSNYTSVKIMRHAAKLDLEQFEDSVF